ncbi:MAG: hypothetical protein RTU30_07445 [Candidatus Thorarchaeota archaeon]
MKRHQLVVLLMMALLLACIPSVESPVSGFRMSCTDDSSMNVTDTPLDSFSIADSHTGVLNPVKVEHTGAAATFEQLCLARTDVYSQPESEIFLPSGAPGNYYSADCTGGYFLVGTSGSADFGSPEGTISCWVKWDITAPNGRLWGQEYDFESRWSSNHLVLDWGSDTSLVGSKNDWDVDHWYFLAITWNEYTNSLAFYWGDEDTVPTEDSSTNLWTGSVVGFHTENNIMNAAARTAQVDGHVDDFRSYTIQRSLDDIRLDYLELIPGYEIGLSHHYQLESGLSDSVGGDNLVASGPYSFSKDVYRHPDSWRGEQIEVSVSDLNTLYVLNGTFENGNPGTNVDWIGDGTYYADGWLAQREFLDFRGRQRASYVQDDGKYVILENEGYLNTAPVQYWHFNGTKIFWYQTVDNSVQNEQFEFSMDYLYRNGPIGSHFQDMFELRFEILDGSTILWNWSIDLVNLTQRQTWFNTGSLSVNITDAPTQFEARVALGVSNSSTYIGIPENDTDLDGDSTNGLFVSVHIDDVSFIGAQSPTVDSVDLTVATSETGPIDISGTSDSGTILLNHSYWLNAANTISFSANTSVSFSYDTKISRMSRIYNSSYMTNLNEQGVSYSAAVGTNANLTLFTYIPSYPEAEDLGFVVYHPWDWGNTSIQDPFGTDKTGLVINYAETVELPSGAVDLVGWWIVRLDGPNYAKTGMTQIHNASSSTWFDETLFKTGDRIRVDITLGTILETPASIMDLMVTWYDPTGAIWSTEIMSNESGNLVRSTGLTIGSSNATTGVWTVGLEWVNGTEIAFGSITFEIHHFLNLLAPIMEFSVQLDENFTASVYLYDQDTGTPILSSDAIVMANWSGYDVFFSPNLAKGWWEADFNTSLTGVGQFNLIINASMPFYYGANFTVTVNVLTLTIMNILGNQFVEISPGGSHTVKMRYMFLEGTGIENASISVLSWTGPLEGLLYDEAEPVLGESGNYSITFTATLSGTYYITITGAKQDLSTTATSFYLIVGPAQTELAVTGEGLPETMYYNQTYAFSLFYHTGDYAGVEGAVVNVTYGPAIILGWTEFGDGYYSISVRVPDVGSYIVFLRFYKQGYDYADFSFNFDITEIPTTITARGIADSYYQGRTYDISFFYNSSLEIGVTGAEVTSSMHIHDFLTPVESESGWYNFTLTPVSGDWNVTFWFDRVGYQAQVIGFTLCVVKIPIVLSLEYPVNQTYSRMEGTVLALQLSPLDSDTGHVLQGATVEYLLMDTNGAAGNIRKQGFFTESMGLYSANITIPEVGLYVLRIEISMDNYEVMRQDIVLSSTVNPAELGVRTLVAGVLGALSLFAVIAVVTITRRFYTTTTTRRNIELLTLKGRLSDSKNLIGFLVIHRLLGLPIYSRIMKGGFEESMLSSFISAISHFRSEFAMDEPVLKAIPITEVITAVQTKHLICAILTVETSSISQKTQLEVFGTKISELFDHDDEALQLMAHNTDLANAFANAIDPVVDQFVDAPLLRKYVGAKKDLPGHLKPISDTLDSLDIRSGITPEAIIRDMTLHGFDERTAFRYVLEAVDNEYLIAGPSKLPSPIETT